MWWMVVVSVFCKKMCKTCCLLLKAKIPICLSVLYYASTKLCFPHELWDKYRTTAARLVDTGRLWSFDSCPLKSNTVSVMRWGISEHLSVHPKTFYQQVATGHIHSGENGVKIKYRREMWKEDQIKSKRDIVWPEICHAATLNSLFIKLIHFSWSFQVNMWWWQSTSTWNGKWATSWFRLISPA